MRPRPPSLLEQSGVGIFALDGSGGAISMRRAYLLMGVHYAMWEISGLCAMAFGAGIGATLGGAGAVLGGLGGTAFSALSIWRRLQTRAIRGRFMDLYRRGASDDAEAFCRRILSSRGSRPLERAIVHHCIALLRMRSGDFADAYEELHHARALQEQWPVNFNLIERAILTSAEVLTLVNLGRLAEARSRFEGWREPRGDFLRLRHLTADLIVQFGEGRLRVPEEEMWRRAHASLATMFSGMLLPLCAWGFAELGEVEMSEHLRAVAIDRDTTSWQALFPALHDWIRR